MHVFLNGQLVKTVGSNLDASHLHLLRLRGGRPAGAPPIPTDMPHGKDLPDHAVVEVDRAVDVSGMAPVGQGRRVNVGRDRADQRVTLRFDGQLVHVIHEGLLIKTLASPVPSGQAAKLRGARLAKTELPPAAPAETSVERKVPRDGVVMVARQRLGVGRTYAGKVVTIYVEDTHFRVTLDGAELSLHERKNQHPVTRWKAKIHAPKV